MIGFQALNAAPIFYDRIIEKPETIASAIRIGNPASWQQARAAIAESQGVIDVLTDADILAAQGWLAQHGLRHPHRFRNKLHLLRGWLGRRADHSY